MHISNSSTRWHNNSQDGFCFNGNTVNTIRSVKFDPFLSSATRWPRPLGVVVNSTVQLLYRLSCGLSWTEPEKSRNKIGLEEGDMEDDEHVKVDSGDDLFIAMETELDNRKYSSPVVKISSEPEQQQQATPPLPATARSRLNLDFQQRKRGTGWTCLLPSAPSFMFLNVTPDAHLSSHACRKCVDTAVSLYSKLQSLQLMAKESYHKRLSSVVS